MVRNVGLAAAGSISVSWRSCSDNTDRYAMQPADLLSHTPAALAGIDSRVAGSTGRKFHPWTLLRAAQVTR
jgi:hypothetical protein